MIINSIKDGRVLYRGAEPTIKKALEEAVQKNIDLSHADFRKADLSGASLDELSAPGACFWGADLSHADLAGSYLHGCDFRLSLLKETCLSESICSQGDFRGTYFGQTLLHDTDFSCCLFSCVSFLRQDLRFVRKLKGSIFYHKGETACEMNGPPLYLRNHEEEIIFLDHYALIQGKICLLSDIPEPYRPLRCIQKQNTLTCNSIRSSYKGMRPDNFVQL